MAVNRYETQTAVNRYETSDNPLGHGEHGWYVAPFPYLNNQLEQRDRGNVYQSNRYKSPGLECTIHKDRDGRKYMELLLDMHEFNADEIQLNVKNNMLEVAAHHKNDKFRSNSMVDYGRQYRLPNGVIKEEISTDFSPRGMLIVKAPIERKFIENEPVRREIIKPETPRIRSIEHQSIRHRINDSPESSYQIAKKSRAAQRMITFST